MKFYVISLMVSLIFVCSGCAEKKVSQNQFLGAWEIVQAERSGKKTETLNGAYFEFDKNNTMVTNILGREESTSYEFDQDNARIIQQGSSSLEFEVLKLEEDILQMETTIREIPFMLSLQKIQ